MSQNYRRFFIQDTLDVGRTAEITGDEYKHLAEVMRAYEGMHIVLLCGDGFDYLAEICAVEKKKILAKVISKTENLNNYKIKINYYCGSLKSDGNFEQATNLSEIGAYSFTVFNSAFSVAKGVNMDKLQRITKESYKQCRRAFPLIINSSCDYFTAIKNCNGNIKLIAYEEEQTLSLGTALNSAEIIINNNYNSISEYLKSNELSVDIFIGSEGGLKAEEVELAKSYGFKSVSLGKNILKATTAAIVSASMIFGQTGEF